MSMEEKYEGIWIDTRGDDSSEVVFENYIAAIDQLHVIYQRADGSYLPYSFVKQSDPQWRLPIWSPENDKAIMPTLESAKEYLISYGARNT